MLHMASCHRREDRTEVEAACCAIQHGQAIEQEAAGQSTQHKIFHGRFSCIAVVAAQGHQGIAGEREQLQTQVNDQKIVA